MIRISIDRLIVQTFYIFILQAKEYQLLNKNKNELIFIIIQISLRVDHF
jgi:hypothetical protein